MIPRMMWCGGLAWALSCALIACAPGPRGQGPAFPTSHPTATAVRPTEMPVPDAALGVPFILPGSQRVVVDGGLTITFQAVPTDSRCPKDVDCVWAGEAKVTLAVEAPGSDLAIITLTTLAELNTPIPASYAGYQLELLDLAPYPQQLAERTPLDHYRATLRVSVAEN